MYTVAEIKEAKRYLFEIHSENKRISRKYIGLSIAKLLAGVWQTVTQL